MIKLILIIPVLLLSIAAFSQDHGKIIQGDIRGQQCRGGLGLCSTVPDSLNRNQNTDMKIFKAIKTSSTSLNLELHTSVLSKNDQMMFFGKEYSKITANEKLVFIQEDDYEFSIEILLYLGFDPRYKYLRKGEYPLRIIDDTVQVQLTLSQATN